MNPHDDRRFCPIGEGSYQLTVATFGIQLTVDRLRRERHELVGEVAVACDLAGAQTIDGHLSVADMNLSSAQARVTRAKLLAQRSAADDVDWIGLVEELCVRTIDAERKGTPSRAVHEYPESEAGSELDIDGWPWLRDQVMITFADGGGLKSYLALYGAGLLVGQGLHVGYADWELSGSDHRARLDRLFPYPRPVIPYFRCDRPLVDEVDRLRREVHRLGLDYLVLDSAGFGTDGPPEAAEAAIGYFRALRQIGVGAHVLAHVNKSETGDQKPFGSTFWHNSARSTWFARHVATAERDRLTIALHNRKANLSRLHPVVGFDVDFSQPGVTTITRANVADVEELAKDLPLAERVRDLLKRNGGAPMTAEDIAEALDAKVKSVARITAPSRSGRSTFAKVPGTDGKTRIALVSWRRP